MTDYSYSSNRDIANRKTSGVGACLTAYQVGLVPAGEIEAAVIDQPRAVFRQTEN